MTDDGAPRADDGASMTDDGASMTDDGASMTDDGASMTDDGASMTDDGASMTGDAMVTESDAELTETEQALLDAINAVRAERDLPPYVADAALVCAARRHAADVGPDQRCDHDGADGSSFSDRARECDGRASAEIIACGQRTPESAVEGWLGSRAGHREAVLNARYTTVGIAMENNYWVGVLR